jgi:hypothetical protein
MAAHNQALTSPGFDIARDEPMFEGSVQEAPLMCGSVRWLWSQREPAETHTQAHKFYLISVRRRRQCHSKKATELELAMHGISRPKTIDASENHVLTP